MYDADANRLLETFQHRSPVLDGCFVDDTQVVGGGLDCSVILRDVETKNKDIVGSHEKAVRCLEYARSMGLIVSGSWDQTVKLWDIREKTPLIATASQPGKVFTMSVTGHRLVVGTSGNRVVVWDLRATDAPLENRTSSLKHMTRVIRCFPDGSGYAVGSVEGRVAVEYLSEEEQKNKYAFKCHRETDDESTTVYPVNALAFHPIYGTFASGGCDGTICIWDGAHKKRLCQLAHHPVGISSLAFNRDGRILAAASSYTFEEGEKEKRSSENIYLHPIQEAQVKPKPRKRKKETN